MDVGSWIGVRQAFLRVGVGGGLRVGRFGSARQGSPTLFACVCVCARADCTVMDGIWLTKDGIQVAPRAWLRVTVSASVCIWCVCVG